MEFRFNCHPLFRQRIVRINNSLLPTGFTAPCRRTALDATAQISEIINFIGQLSAQAQGLSNPVTTSQKLRNSDHHIYLMFEPNEKHGLVVGILKVGHKSLYVFDQNGETVNVTAPCVLDFYVHESRQRGGLGRELFEHMLNEEKIQPQSLAIDRPSEKLLGFLQKHYGLYNKIPQMNNFVVYEGFFSSKQNGSDIDGRRMHITASPNTNLFGPTFTTVEDRRRSNSQTRQPAVSPPLVQQPPVGRYAAKRPSCSMAQIIHNSPNAVSTEPNSQQHTPEHPGPRKPIRYTKQHTGLKNMSSGVGAAVTPSAKMEFDQEENEGFGSVKINRPIGKSNTRNSLHSGDDNESVHSKGSDSSHMTEHGHFDLKFYHNKLW
ncbi:alpha-tubulin N-acetyltransferase isoform X2 [Culex pipiens pallens]|uniref:alpha-tubulin N-acetyltransferase isoform X2 n=1 Tax=Culex pipiens pallens TaxID=42434 RepID=UPI0019547ABA|nr:alpha-tubulin N-acetyltransferase isoform X2 [Culex pipiens pallens]